MVTLKMVWTLSPTHGLSYLSLVPVHTVVMPANSAGSNNFSRGSHRTLETVNPRRQDEQSARTDHLWHTWHKLFLAACMFIQFTHRMEDSLWLCMFGKKTTGIANPHLKQPSSVEQGSCQFTIWLFMFTLWTHLFGTAEHDSQLTIRSFPFTLYACMYLGT